MNIIKAGFDIIPRDEERGGLAIIERAARTCYKTENRITDDSAEGMVSMLIRRGHEAMLEHGDYIFQMDDSHAMDYLLGDLMAILFETGRRIRLNVTKENRRYIVSGNVRAWRELMQSGHGSAYYFAGDIDPIYIADLMPEAERVHDPHVTRIRYEDLKGGLEQRAHIRQTVRFTIDRGVSHEFVRHRDFSFAQESTRYCNYSQNRFGSEITVIEPCFLIEGTEPYSLWKRQCMSAEVAYFQALNDGLAPEEARDVLPTSVKTELVMTGTLGDWKHFFDLRALELTGKAHPQAVEVAKPLMLQMAPRFPMAFSAME